jgi:Schlafen, AlbA_2
MFSLETKSDLERLIADDIQESLTLEYKDAAALGKSSPQRSELCKDVSAFANSAGGQIIYGIQEKDRHPVRVQEADAVDLADITREWIEQVIDSNVQPRIQNLRIQPIDVAPGRAAYVITILQAMSNAPHQAPDHKYYYRQNFQSVPMEDYQVRDTMRRATTPELFVKLSFKSGTQVELNYSVRKEISDPIALLAFIGNRSSQPAFHSIVQLGIDAELKLRYTGDFKQIGQRTDAQNVLQNWLERRLSSPADLPIFKESELLPLSSKPLAFECSSDLVNRGDHYIYLTTSVQTPGYAATEKWIIYRRGTTLRLCEPGHPMNT